MKSLKENIVLNVLYASSFILFSLVTFPYVSRVLGPDGTGKVSFVRSVISVFLLFSRLGLPVYGVRACAKVRDDKALLSKTVKELFTIAVIMECIVLVAFAAAFLLWPKIQSEKELFLIFSLQLLIDGLGMEWLFKGIEEFRYMTIRSIIIRLLFVVGIFVFLKTPEHYVRYGALIVFAETVPLLLNLLTYRRFVQPTTKATLDIKQHIKPLIMFFALSLAAVLYSNMDKIILGIMRSDAEVGYYDVAIRIKDLLINVLSSAVVVVMSRASFHIEKKQFDEFGKIIEKGILLTFALGLLIVMSFEVTTPLCIHILAGKAFDPSILIMRIMLPAVFFFGFANIYGTQILVPYGLEKHVLIAELSGTVLDFILNLLLIPSFGTTGAAIGSLAGQILVVLMEFVAIKRLLPEVKLGLKLSRL